MGSGGVSRPTVGSPYRLGPNEAARSAAPRAGANGLVHRRGPDGLPGASYSSAAGRTRPGTARQPHSAAGAGCADAAGRCAVLLSGAYRRRAVHRRGTDSEGPEHRPCADGRGPGHPKRHDSLCGRHEQLPRLHQYKERILGRRLYTADVDCVASEPAAKEYRNIRLEHGDRGNGRARAANSSEPRHPEPAHGERAGWNMRPFSTSSYAAPRREQ